MEATAVAPIAASEATEAMVFEFGIYCKTKRRALIFFCPDLGQAVRQASDKIAAKF